METLLYVLPISTYRTASDGTVPLTLSHTLEALPLSGTGRLPWIKPRRARAAMALGDFTDRSFRRLQPGIKPSRSQPNKYIE
jgi:hypothetical protein